MLDARLLALGLVFLVAGCGGGPDLPPTAYVAGTVTIDGRPLHTGTVQFVPDTADREGAIPAVGEIGPDGKFVLYTAGVRGALVGTHRVRVSAIDLGAEGAPWLIPIRYNRVEESGLMFEVKPGQRNTIDLELSSL